LYKYIIKALVLLTVIIIGYLYLSYAYPKDIGDKVVSVIIKPGDGFATVAEQLLDGGVVRSGLMLKLPARWRELDKKLVVGRYDFTGENSCRSVLSKLERGDFLKIRVTVYEGAPIWKVASVLAERMEVDSLEIMALSTDSLFLDSLGLPYLEGYLYPETYFFPWGTNTRQMLSEMTAMHKAQTADLWTDTIPNGLSREEVIVLASIVEAEALRDDEKPRIASVYQNRLRKRMKLDADPTVIYGLGGLDRPLSRRDLKKDTPYNTYRKRGLPPTPINSPGLAAIKAVLQPETTEYLYFVADGTGYHRFSKTNAEHNRARYEIKQKRRTQTP